MRFIATILVLGLVTAVRGDEEPLGREWEQAVERFWKLASKTGLSAESTPWSGELDGKFRELMMETLVQLNASCEQLQARLGPYSKQFQADLELLRERLEQDLESVRSTVQTYHQEAHLMLRQNVEDVRRTLGLYLRKYRKRLVRDRAEIRRKFEEYQELLGSQGQRAVEGIREVVDPIVTAAGGQLRERLEAFADDLRRRTDEIQVLTQSLREQAAVNTQELHELVGRTMAAIQSWFQTESQKVSSYFQSLIDSALELPEGKNA